MKKLWPLITLLFISEIRAVTLSPFVDLNTARVMPKRITSLRWKGILTRATERFNDQRQSGSMAELFETPLTYRKLVGIEDPTSDPAERGGLLGVLNEWGDELGITLDQEAGRVTGDISVGVSTSVPIFVHGITNRLTIAVALPIFKYKISVDSGFVANASLEKLAEKFRKEKKYYALNELIEGMNRPVEEGVERYNYEPFENQEGQAIGDLITAFKYRVLSETNHGLALQTDITFPTGQEKNINKLVYFPIGDGQLDLGFSAIYDYYFNEDTYLTTSLKYTWEISDTSSERIPFASDMIASPDIDTDVDRNLGDHVHFQLGGQVSPLKGLQTRLAYNFHYKGRDLYKGNSFESVRYSWLGQDSEQWVHTYMLGISVSNIPWVRVSKNFLPLELNVSYLGFLAGKNTVKNPLLSFELATYF
ncbi:MAG: hypothetical protein DRQ88_00210 [Epsilonproteobacteria bacterium]|nr:MAG: hypothetical protein DRQ89_06135 [Campylobacterota bacterium]RLA68059.1 MAG: hypothetical protein DRQ88_00210 [Campylobacterota bacterium]